MRSRWLFFAFSVADVLSVFYKCPRGRGREADKCVLEDKDVKRVKCILGQGREADKFDLEDRRTSVGKV